MSVSFEVCTKPHVKFEWKLNGANLTDDVIVDHGGAGITIPELRNVHFGLYEFTAINLINGMDEKRTFRIECEGDNTSIGNSIKFQNIMVSISFSFGFSIHNTIQNK